MLIPRYWAEAMGQTRPIDHPRPLQFRRWGWSSVSQVEAEDHANKRLQSAIEAAKQTKRRDLRVREPRVHYGGADGLPIREEILSEQPHYTLTRNSYGATCLNTPAVLFADIDLDYQSSGIVARFWLVGITLLTICYLSGFWNLLLTWVGIAFLVLGVIFAAFKKWAAPKDQLALEQAKLATIEKWAERYHRALFRVYRTPRGFRVLAMHDLFDPSSETTKAILESLGSDPIYIKMCRLQRCFRARLTPKPWRLGIAPMPHKGAVWPLPQEKVEKRNAWQVTYQLESQGFAACQFLFQRGNGNAHPIAQVLCHAHDHASGALEVLPMA